MQKARLFLPLCVLTTQLVLAQQPTQEPKPPAGPEPSFEELIEIKAVPYKPSLSRDPFRAPTDAEQQARGDLVEDMGVKGWVRRGGKMMLLATDSRGNIKTLPIGYKFRDGEIVAVTDKSVTFHCWEMNSTNTSAYRTVVKTFKREEGKR